MSRPKIDGLAKTQKSKKLPKQVLENKNTKPERFFEIGIVK